MKTITDFVKKKLQEADVKDFVFLFTIVTVTVGFLIVNLHLGSFGIIKLDILRFKYISAALLFYAFYTCFYIPFYGARGLILKAKNLDVKLIGDLIGHTFQWYFIVLLLSSAMSIISGATHITTPKGNVVPSTIETSEVLYYLSLVMLIIICFALGLAILVYCVKFFGKDGYYRKGIAKKKLISSSLYLLKIICLLPSYGFLLLGVLYILFQFHPADAIHIPFFEAADEWQSFLKTSMLCYIVGTLYVLTHHFFSLILRVESTDVIEDTVVESTGYIKFYTWKMLYFCLIIGLFAKLVYPNIPQQIGGGKPVKVILELIQQDEIFSMNSGDIYLIERSDATSIFAIGLIDSGTTRIIELNNSEIRKIEYMQIVVE